MKNPVRWAVVIMPYSIISQNYLVNMFIHTDADDSAIGFCGTRAVSTVSLP